MNRSTQRKLSRALIGGLGLTLALGSVFWLGKIVGSNSSADQHARAERGETSEAVVAAKAAASGAGAGADAGTATGRPSDAASPASPASPADPFAAKLAQANVLETPTAPVMSSPASDASPATPASPATLAGGGSTTRPSSDGGILANAPAPAPAQANTNVQLASISPSAGAGVSRSDMLSGNPIADAKLKLEHGKMLDARRILNAALTSGQLSEADARAVKQMLNEINAVVVFSSKQFEGDEFGGTFVVPPGGVLDKIAKSHDISRELIQRINGITDPRRLRAQQTIKVLKGPFNAVVDKSEFSLELWIGEPGAKGSMFVTSLPVGLGEHDSTPTGVWAVKNRLPNPAYFSPRGEGVVDADDPKNPLGEYWIGLSGSEGNAVGKESYGIHGTIEPDSIGKQASMGCIRLTNENVQKVYEALVDGKSTVTVRE